MTEFQELIQDAPNFVSMERGELVTYAYGMFAAGTKANAENAKLRRLAHDALLYGNERSYGESLYKLKEMARDLGVEVD